jgi:hypothetical protein
MDMSGSRLLAVTQQQAWDALNDPEVLMASIPGCDKMEKAGDGMYSLGVQVKIGPVSARFSGKILLSDVVPLASYTLSFEGQGGAAGFGKGSSAVQLAPQDGGTLLSYTVKAQVGGKIAQLGQRLIDGAAKSMAEDFFRRFDEELRRRYPPPPGAAGPVLTAGAADHSHPARGGSVGLPLWAWVVIATAIVGLALYLIR